MACPKLIVKNTFICAVGDEALSPPNHCRERAKTWSDASTQASSAGSAELEAPTLSPCLLDFGDEESCQHAQRTLETTSFPERHALVETLRGRVREAASSPHGHLVLEAVVRSTSTEEAAFIAEELLDQSREALLNFSTCSVMCRLVEYSPNDPGTSALVDKLFTGDIATLLCHKCGHHVVRAIVSAGFERHAAQVVAALHGNLQRFARHRIAHKVLESVLLSSPPRDSESLAHELIAQPGTVGSLACHNFGVHVVRALLQLPGHSRQVSHYLLKSSRRLLKDKYGCELMRDLGMAPQPAVRA